MSSPPELWTCRLGTIEYRDAVAVQEGLRARVQAGELPDLLLLLEHPPVYTLGRRSDPGDLPMSEEACRARGIDVVQTTRGGKLTYHGPGQLVGYPIQHVEDILAFLRTMETAIRAVLAEEGIETVAAPRPTGVWAGERKIASIGLHVSRGVSMHGFAINVDNDLSPFRSVIPCGMPDVEMTSVAEETGRSGRLECVAKRMGHAYARAHGLRQRLVTPERLGVPRPVPAAA
jgi:lipoyl(octanoyl) transferase